MNIETKVALYGLLIFILFYGSHRIYENWKTGIYKDGQAEVQAKWDADKLVQSKALVKLTQEYRERETSNEVRHTKALDEKNIQLQTLAADRDDALRTVSRMSSDLNAARAKLSATTTPACAASVEYARAVTDVFESCTERYRDMAEKAEQHRIDAQALKDAWPQ